MLRFYNTAILPLRALAELRCWWARGRPEDAVEWRERLARTLPRAPGNGVWIHAASVGEARLLGLLADGLRRCHPDLPLYASSVTRTGRSRLPDSQHADAAFFAPLDFPGLNRRLLAALRPRALILVETELWPNLLRETLDARVAVLLVNGRLAEHRMGRYRALRRLYSPLLAGLSRIGAQSQRDAERFLELGVPADAVTVTGNIKYDLPPPRSSPETLRRRLGLAAERPVLVAGSTGPGEEALVLDALRGVTASSPDAFLVLAPRHPERFDEVAELVRRRGLALHRLSRANLADAGRASVLLVDTLGQLAELYALAAAALVGGSLVPVGGHNLLEPAAAGVPVLFGPHTDHVEELATALLDAGGGRRVADAAELGAAWARLLSDRDTRREMGRRAGKVVQRNRGALERTLQLIAAALALPPAARGGVS